MANEVVTAKRNVAGSNVCVVGGAGFLGSHLVDYLVELECEVLVVDNLVVGRKEFVNPKAQFVHHDITTSEEFLRKLFERHAIEYVFNYAAYPYVPDSFVRPLHVFNVNAMGAMKVINAAQEAGCVGILQVSSAELYGEGQIHDTTTENNKVWRTKELGSIAEDCQVIPHSSYGAAKAAIDAYCQCSWKERETPVIALRQFNCCGERDCLHPYVIPEIITQLYTGRMVRLGNDTRRDFMYAGDAVRVAVQLLQNGQFGEVFNLGSEKSIGIYDLARKIGRIMWDDDIRVITEKKRCRPWELWHLQSDNSKIKKAIGWSGIEVPFEEALKRTISWLVDHIANTKYQPYQKFDFKSLSLPT